MENGEYSKCNSTQVEVSVELGNFDIRENRESRKSKEYSENLESFESKENR